VRRWDLKIAFKYMINLSGYALQNNQLHPGGCLALALAAIESAFDDQRRNEPKLDREINRAFLDSDIVHAAVDCTDTHEVKRIIKEFDKIRV
jgi:hypothetical protein